MLRRRRGSRTTVKGWVRTVRVGKEVTFIALNDGSCLAEPAGGGRPGTAELRGGVPARHRRCPRGHGDPAESPAAGQNYELQARGDRDRRPGRRDLPDAEEAAQLRIPAHHRPSPAAHQHLRRGLPGPLVPRPGDPPLLCRARLPLRPYPDHHRQRLRGGGGDVPGHHPRPGTSPAGRAARWITPGTSSARRPG